MSQVRKACVESLPAETMEPPIVPVPAELMNSEDSAFEESVQREVQWGRRMMTFCVSLGVFVYSVTSEPFARSN